MLDYVYTVFLKIKPFENLLLAIQYYHITIILTMKYPNNQCCGVILASSDGATSTGNCEYSTKCFTDVTKCGCY